MRLLRDVFGVLLGVLERSWRLLGRSWGASWTPGGRLGRALVLLCRARRERLAYTVAAVCRQHGFPLAVVVARGERRAHAVNMRAAIGGVVLTSHVVSIGVGARGVSNADAVSGCRVQFLLPFVRLARRRRLARELSLHILPRFDAARRARVGAAEWCYGTRSTVYAGRTALSALVFAGSTARAAEMPARSRKLALSA